MENSNSAYQHVILTESYQGLSYKNNLNDHIVSVLDYASDNVDTKVLRSKDLKFSKQLYWECLDTIYQKNPIEIDKVTKEQNKRLKNQMYRSIITNLGEFFRIEDELLVETIDFTISNYMDNCKYGSLLGANNPFLFSNNIFIDNKLLYTFTDNKDEYSHLFKINKKESEVSKDLTIGVLGKGHRKGYSHAYIKDIYALRNLLLNLLDEQNHDSRKPLKINDLFKNFRDLGISDAELTNSNIKNWIVQPLKRFTKLGSNKDGYFLIRTEEDLYESYKSHHTNYLGFYKTLQRHKKFAETLAYENHDFNKHNDLFIDKNDQ